MNHNNNELNKLIMKAAVKTGNNKNNNLNHIIMV